MCHYDQLNHKTVNILPLHWRIADRGLLNAAYLRSEDDFVCYGGQHVGDNQIITRIERAANIKILFKA